MTTATTGNSTENRLDLPNQGPIERSNSEQLDLDSTDSLNRASADALSRVLGQTSLDALREHHLALAMAVIELAADAGRPLPWTTDDPTVALLRAAAKLTIDHPDATSSAAAGLIDRLAQR